MSSEINEKTIRARLKKELKNIPDIEQKLKDKMNGKNMTKKKKGLDRFNKGKNQNTNKQQPKIVKSFEDINREAIRKEYFKYVGAGEIDGTAMFTKGRGANDPIINEDRLMTIQLRQLANKRNEKNKHTNNNGGNNQINQILPFLILQMLNNQKKQQNQPSLNADMMKAFVMEVQNFINKQNQQNQQPVINPVTLMMLQSINQSNQGQGIKTDKTTKVLLDKFNTMMQNNQTQNMARIMQQSHDRFERGMEVIAGALNRERPEEKLMKNFELFRNITGDTRAKTEIEMDYNLRKDEMELNENARQDTLDRQERDEIREDKKSEQVMKVSEIVLDKIVGNGLGGLVGDFKNIKKAGLKRRGRKEQQNERFDISILDEL